MKNRVELQQYIRYQLAQLGTRNGAHEFEQLCFALARLRHVSNLQPATGPVQAGGDQGRDFESYITYLRSSSLARSTFLSLVSADVVVGACTLERHDTAAKVRSDLAVIFSGGVRPDHVIYFCEPDIPVARRHILQDYCLAHFGATLNLHDGTAIADQLADPDTFWIAEQYLNVPMDMFPSDVGDEDYPKRRSRWLDERTQRIEAKLNDLAKDEQAEAAERHWAYIQNHTIRTVTFFFVLKCEVGLEWFRGILNGIQLTFAREDYGRWSLGTLLDASGSANTGERGHKTDSPICSFWEVYKHAPGYWVRRTDCTPRRFSVVAGFDVTAPWSMVGVPEVAKLADLAKLNEIGFSIPPDAYLPGIEEFVIDFDGDTFAFSIALSDHTLDFLHQMAQTFRSVGSNANVGSFGVSFSGIQLLELFRDQLGPNPKYPRKGIGLFGLSTSDGRGIAFYPKMPPDFMDTPEAANYDHTITLTAPGEPDIQARLKELEDQIAATPSDPKPYAELAARYSRQGRIMDCIRCLEQAIERAPPDVIIHGLLGEALAEIGRIDESADHFAKAAELDPESCAALRGCAACLVQRGDLESAIPYFEAVVKLDPADWRNHANLGFTLASCKRYAEAIACYQHAVGIAPGELDNILRLGWLFEIESRYEEALGALEQAVRIAPTSAEACWHTGRMLAKLGRFEEAVESFHQSIAIEETADRQLSLGDAFVQLSHWSDAQTAFRRAIDLGANGPDIRYGLACVMVNQGKVAEAKSELEQLLSAASDHTLAKALLTELQQ